MGQTILGLDVGGTKTAAVIGDETGRVFARESIVTDAGRGFEPVFDDLCAVARRVLEHGGGEGRRAEVVSVSIGGPLDVERGIVFSPPNLPGWDEIPLKRLLEEEFGLPAFVEHDGNAGALAEWRFGAARGARHVVFLTMGTGLGGGLILNGQLYRGACDLAGEVGHIRQEAEGPVAYGKAGSWEAFCSGAGMARLASWRFPDRWGAEQVDARELARLAAAGDADAAAVVAETGERLGRGLAVLVDLLNPEVIVIGSLAVRFGDRLLEPARKALRREALPAAAEACRVVPAELGERLGDVAALCAAIMACQGDAPDAEIPGAPA